MANEFKSAMMTPGRNLEEEPLSAEEIEMLAEGYPPSTLGGLDHEEVVMHLATKVLDLQEEMADIASHSFE